MHRAHAVVGAQHGAEEASAEMEFHRVCLDGQVLRLAREITEDNQNRVGRRNVLRFANHDEDVLIVTVEGEVFAGVESGVAVMNLDESAIPVEERIGIGIF
jgi:hypothetical protein